MIICVTGIFSVSRGYHKHKDGVKRIRVALAQGMIFLLLTIIVETLNLFKSKTGKSNVRIKKNI